MLFTTKNNGVLHLAGTHSEVVSEPVGTTLILFGTGLHLSGGVELTDVTTEPGRLIGRVKTSWNYPVKVTPQDSPKMAA